MCGACTPIGRSARPARRRRVPAPTSATPRGAPSVDDDDVLDGAALDGADARPSVQATIWTRLPSPPWPGGVAQARRPSAIEKPGSAVTSFGAPCGRSSCRSPDRRGCRLSRPIEGSLASASQIGEPRPGLVPADVVLGDRARGDDVTRLGATGPGRPLRRTGGARANRCRTDSSGRPGEARRCRPRRRPSGRPGRRSVATAPRERRPFAGGRVDQE